MARLPEDMTSHPEFDHQLFIRTFKTFTEIEDIFFPGVQERIFKTLISRVTFDPESLELEFSVDGLMDFFEELLSSTPEIARKYRQIYLASKQ